MKCLSCQKAFANGARVVEVRRYTLNSKVSDGRLLEGYIHLACVVK